MGEERVGEKSNSGSTGVYISADQAKELTHQVEALLLRKLETIQKNMRILKYLLDSHDKASHRLQDLSRTR
jgi:hypothetical protein